MSDPTEPEQMIGSSQRASAASQEITISLEAQYRSILDAMGDGIHVVDRELRVVYANPAVGAWLNRLGINLDPTGRRLSEVYPNLPTEVFGEYDEVFATGRVVVSEDTTLVGQRISSSDTRKIPIFDGPRVAHVLTVVRDITERKRREEALRASEEKYRYLVENVSDVIYALDADGRLTYLSPSIEPFLGYAPDEMIGHHFAEYVASGDSDRSEEGFRTVISGQNRVNEYRGKTKCGKTKWMRCSSKPVIEDGRVVGVHGVLTDITERKEAEEQLRASEERFRGILAALHEAAIIVMDHEGKLTAVWTDSSLEEKYGIRRSDIVGKSLAEIVGPVEAEAMLGVVQQVFSTGTSVRTEFSGELLGGSFSSDVILSPLRGPFGEVTAVVGFIRDISERVYAERALRESEERWRSLVQYAPDLVVTLDREGCITYINRPLTGTRLTLEEILGESILSFVHPEHRDSLLEAFDAVFELGETVYREAAAVGPDGEGAGWYAVHAGPLQFDGEVEAALLLARDITERRQIMEMKENLIRDVSHELRTPLAKVQMSLELLEELLRQEPVNRDRLNSIFGLATRSAQRLLHTVEGILDLSSLEAGVTARRMDTLNPRQLLHDAVHEMRPLAQAKGLVIVEDIPHSLPAIEADYEKLFRLLTNLIDNAIKFTDSGRVAVAASACESHIEIAVSDTGSGIEPANLERVFERFFQERPRYEGVGVGLSICRRIVEAHGGRIWAESAGRGQGTAVRFTLPVGSQASGAQDDQDSSDCR